MVTAITEPKPVTIQDAYKAKQVLEAEVATLLQQFTDQTGLKVEYLNIEQLATMAGSVIYRVDAEAKL